MMRKVLSIYAILIVLSLALVFASISHLTLNNPKIHIKQSESSNWAGYAVATTLALPQEGSVDEVSASWVVPSVNCTDENTFSSMWIGIDGYSSSTVEQIGTESDCVFGSPRYYAWYELYPSYPVKIKIQVNAGDLISAKVTSLGKDKFEFSINDITTNGRFSRVQKLRGAKSSSAEWIVELPSSVNTLQLSNFGIAKFIDANVVINGKSGSIVDSSWQKDAISMTSSLGGDLKAEPFNLSETGKEFSVIWLSN